MTRGSQALLRSPRRLRSGGTGPVDRWLDAEPYVLALGRFRGTARASGLDFEVRLSHVWKLMGGRVVWVWNYFDTGALLRALNG
jgi:ketosteroid isomerase-like protein